MVAETLTLPVAVGHGAVGPVPGLDPTDADLDELPLLVVRR